MSKQIPFKSIVILIISLLAISNLFAQNVVTSKTDSVNNKRAQNIYVEIFGPGLIFSVNYDTRFSNKQDGLGGRIGVGGYSIDASSLFSVPLQLNYLLGKNNRFFELGIGFTYFKYVGSDLIFFNSSKINVGKAIGTMTFGYRYQPKEGGFTYTIAINPVFNGKTFVPYWFGSGFGYSF